MSNNEKHVQKITETNKSGAPTPKTTYSRLSGFQSSDSPDVLSRTSLTKKLEAAAPMDVNIGPQNNQDDGADLFKRSSLIQRSPVRSSSLGNFQTLSDSKGPAKGKRLREETPSLMTDQSNLINKIDREVFNLCTSVKESSNTKKEIRDISAKLRALVSRLVTYTKEIPKTASASLIDLDLTESDNKKARISTSSSIGSELYQSTTNLAKPEMVDASVQTDYVNIKPAKKEKLKKQIDVQSLLDAEMDEKDLESLVLEAWPGSVYQRTMTEKVDIVDLSREECRTIFIGAGTPEVSDCLQPHPRINEMLQGRFLTHGETALVRTSDSLVKGGETITSSFSTNFFALDSALEGAQLVTTVWNMIKEIELVENMVFGTTVPSFEVPLRKLLEIKGRKDKKEIRVCVNKIDRIKTDKKDWKAAKRKKKKVESIVVTPADGANYADVVKLMKRQVDPEKCGVNVRKVQPTKKGEILIKLVGKSSDGIEKFKKEIDGSEGFKKSELLQDKETVVLRDVDENISAEDVVEAVEKKLGGNVSVHVNLSERTNHAGNKLAFVTVPKACVDSLLQNRRLYVGWSSCRLERKILLLKCFKCLGFGHKANACKSAEKRAALCYKCSGEGHVAKDCKNELKCYVCNTPGHRADSMNCPDYRKKMLEVRGTKKGLNTIHV